MNGKHKIIGGVCIIIVIIICAAVFWYSRSIADKAPLLRPEQVQRTDQLQQAADIAGVSLSDSQVKDISNKISTAKAAGRVVTTAGNVQQTAQEQQQLHGSDFAPVLDDVDIDTLPEDTAVELQQYHIYAAPKIQREIGVKLDDEASSHISGVSYGIKRRISAKGQYIGVRLDYDWRDQQGSIWATYSW